MSAGTTPIRLTATVLLLGGLTGTAPAAAATPEHVTQARDVPVTYTIDCGDFVAQGSGTFSARVTTFVDADGRITRFTEHVEAPRDVWVNPVTGASVTVRAQFTQVHRRIADTDEFNRTVTGFRYVVNQPGSGIVVKDVGRVVYDDLDETTWSFLAGHHDWLDKALIEPGICDLLR